MVLDKWIGYDLVVIRKVIEVVVVVVGMDLVERKVEYLEEYWFEFKGGWGGFCFGIVGGFGGGILSVFIE